MNFFCCVFHFFLESLYFGSYSLRTKLLWDSYYALTCISKRKNKKEIVNEFYFAIDSLCLLLNHIDLCIQH